MQVPGKLFHKWSNKDQFITFDHYASENDLVAKFRVFENENVRDDKKTVLRHLVTYAEDPYTKPELIARMAELADEDSVDLSKVFRVKRVGLDRNDLFWAFGKLHGLENIGLVDPKKLAECEGNPVMIQELLNAVDPKDQPRYESHEHVIAKLEKTLVDYRGHVDNMGLAASDRKRLLALPFYLHKRNQLPEPRRGQAEWDLYREIYGEEYLNELDLVTRDDEEKITEFNFEKFFPAGALDGVDTTSAEFKNKIKLMNLNSKTKYEQHMANKKEFQQLMPVLSGLEADEMRALIHKLKNDKRKFGAEHEHEIMHDMVSGDVERELAKLSEEQNFALKNRYRHQRQTLDYAEKKRMPIDQSKVRDLLRHQHIFREKIESQIDTLTALETNTQLENGLLTYLNEAAYGDMKALIRDVGINNNTLEFYNLARLRQADENKMFDSDRQLKYLTNALFTPLNMTDYEESFVGWNELPKHVPIVNQSLLDVRKSEPMVKTDKLATIEAIENRPVRGTSGTHYAMAQANAADPEEEDDISYGQEDEEEDYDEEGEGGEADYGDYDEEEEVPEEDAWPTDDTP